MRKQALVVEWVIAENDADWERLRLPLLPDNEPTANRSRPLKRYFWSLAALLLLLAGAGEWWRRSTAASLQAAAAELRTTVQQKPLAVVTPDDDALIATSMNEPRNADWWLHHAWEYSTFPAPVQPDDPMVPVELDGEEPFFAVWGPRDPRPRLDEIVLSMPSEEYVGQAGPGHIAYPSQTVALAALVEYGVAIYGRERLPILVAGVGQYDSWATLVPAVFGVSALNSRPAGKPI